MKKVTIKRSKIHQKGGFATVPMKKGELVIEYTGKKITKTQAERSQSVYIFDLNKRYDILGRNAARYINHSCDPNCEADIIKNRVWIVASRSIKKGEELTYNYNYGLEDFWDTPCACGAKKCVGYMVAEDHWPRLKKHHLHRRHALKRIS